jgi:hypothetical protein
MEGENTFLPLLGPATPASKPSNRKTFWSENSWEIDRIDAKSRYVFSNSSSSISSDGSDTTNTEVLSSSQEVSSSNTDIDSSSHEEDISATLAESHILNSKEMTTITLSAWVAIGLRFIGPVTKRCLCQKEIAVTRLMPLVIMSTTRQSDKKVD